MGATPSSPSARLTSALEACKEPACRRAAELISKADVLLFCTGAGFSADSGLAVYADVAEVQAYKERGLTYQDICQPRWLASEPELFWGFWGQCFNDYRNTAPHMGYEIVERWAERKFRHSPVAASIRATLEELHRMRVADGGGNIESSELEPYLVEDRPGAFFAFTSNVDAHHFDWFQACEIRECHGNTEVYQCSAVYCRSSGIWRAPAAWRFSVDRAAMLAPAGALPEGGVSPEEADAARMPQTGQAASAPAVGRVRGGGRSTTLRYMPGPAPQAAQAGFLSNHPVCRTCGQPARPAILMFGDSGWSDSTAQCDRWLNWQQAVNDEAQKATSERRTPLRVVIMEIGAGGNVTTVRNTSESCLSDWRGAGAEVHLIRVNPELPLGDDKQYRPKEEEEVVEHYSVEGLLEMPVLSVMSRGLEALVAIDAALAQLPNSGFGGGDAGASPASGDSPMA